MAEYNMKEIKIDESENVESTDAINESELEKVVGGCAPSENDLGIPTGEIIGQVAKYN